MALVLTFFFFFQAEDGIRDLTVTGVQTCALPISSDVPVVRNFTRVGYRELLRAGVRVFEYQGPMLHAKTLVADRRWARVGSSNLNVSSLLTNYELDVVVESEPLTDALAAQVDRDLAARRQIP